MELLKQPPTSKAPAELFTGDAWWDVIYAGVEPSRARANMVKFAPGARTAWHSHAMGQTLYIVEGIALIQNRGGEIIEAHPGDIIFTPPNEEHWHGAAPDQFMIHLALWESPGEGNGPENTWGDHVTDAEYNGRHLNLPAGSRWIARSRRGAQPHYTIGSLMRATLIYGAGDVRVEDVPDPRVQKPTDAVVRVLRSAIGRSDLWPYGRGRPPGRATPSAGRR